MSLFPGVRLNLGGGGISTTIGVRGASINLGAHGAHLNVGLPGTGLSYRTKISPEAPSFRGSGPAFAPPAGPEKSPRPEQYLGEAHEIRSADIGILTSPGLDELKKLINEASAERTRLTLQEVRDQAELKRVNKKLLLAKLFIVRIFTKRLVARLAAAVAAAEDKLAGTRDHLGGCGINIEFAFEADTKEDYAKLISAFEELRTCNTIWDITSTVLNNRFVQRTIATYSVMRTPVRFDFAESSLIKTNFHAMRLGNVTGLDIHIYPGFLMMRGSSEDFALVELKDLTLSFGATRFLEEETIPADSKIVGQTWKKSNKDGSRDRRFNNNYQIPLCLYGELLLKSPTGLLEAYMVSNAEKAQAFALVLESYRNLLANLAARNRSTTHETPPRAFLQGPSDPEKDELQLVTIPELRPPPKMMLDRICLAVVILGVAFLAYWWTTNYGISPKPGLVPAVNASIPPPVANRVSDTPPANAPLLQPSTAPYHETLFTLKPAHIRARPSSSAPVVVTRTKDAKLTVFQRKGDWVEVGDTDPIGWVYGSLLGAKAR